MCGVRKKFQQNLNRWITNDQLISVGFEKLLRTVSLAVGLIEPFEPFVCKGIVVIHYTTMLRTNVNGSNLASSMSAMSLKDQEDPENQAPKGIKQTGVAPVTGRWVIV